MRRVFASGLAALALTAGFVAPAYAESGEDAFARAVMSCIHRQSGAFSEVFAAEEISQPAADAVGVAFLTQNHGPPLKIASETGTVYLVKESDRCEAWGYDIDATKAVAAVGRLVEDKPYKGAVPSFLKGVDLPPINGDKLVTWSVKTPRGLYKLVGGIPIEKTDKPVFMSVTRQ